MQTVAIVGCAHIHTPGFVKMLQGRSDVRVAHVFDPDPARAANHAAALGAEVAAEPSRIWKDRDVASVIICSETNRHRELVAAACRHGKHLFVEKPLGMGARDADAMATAIEKAGVIFQTGYFMRGQPAVRCIREHLAAGAFGRVTRIRGSNCHSGSLGGWFDTEWRWMADPAIAGCGAFGDLGTHALDIMLWLVGNPEAVTGHIGVATGRYGDCDEYGEGMLRFADGIVGTLAAGWVDVANPVSLLVSGTEGHAAIINGQLFLQSKHIEGADGKAPWKNLPPAWPHAFNLFLDATGGSGAPELVGAREAAVRSAVMEAIYRGAAKGTWVRPLLR